MRSAAVSGSSAPKRKGEGPQRREEILAAALRLFSEFGVHTVSTRQIAAAVGISQPSLYAYFPTKQALVDEVCSVAFGRLTARMQGVLERAAESDRDLMAALARVYIDFGLAEPDAYRVAFMLEDRRDRAGVTHVGMIQAGLNTFAIYRDAVARAMGPGHSGQDVELTAQSRWACLHGLVALFIARPEFPWADRQRLIDNHVRYVSQDFSATR
jgi:AcrR family transcriptional regulator